MAFLSYVPNILTKLSPSSIRVRIGPFPSVCTGSNNFEDTPYPPFVTMSNAINPFSLFSPSTLYEDIEEQTAISQSVAAAVMALTEYPETKVLRGKPSGSKTIHRGPCPWIKDYIIHDPIYPSSRFRQVFRIPLKLYHVLHDELLEEEEPLLRQQFDNFGKPGHTSHQKI